MKNGMLDNFKFSMVLSPLIFSCIIILIWIISIHLFSIPNYILPMPDKVLQVFIKQFSSLYQAAIITSVEALLGFALGSLLGFISAILFVHSRIIERAMYPYAIALKTIPLVALAPLLTLWFGTDMISKVIMASLLCYFPVLVNLTIGLRQIDDLHFAYFKSIAATKRQIFFKVRIPSAMPYLFSSLRIAVTLSMIGAVVAELTGADRGLGYQILAASYRLETDKLFAAIIFLGIIGILFFCIIILFEKLLVPWQTERE